MRQRPGARGATVTAIGRSLRRCCARRCGVSAMALCSTGTLMGPTELDFSGPGNDEAAAIRNRLAALRAEQAALQARLAELDTDRANVQSSPLDAAPVTASSSPAEKIALFGSLFRGREDVFPKRWSNARSGRSGYVPACANEWAPRICDKPRIKCRECPNQAFIPVTAEVIARHLRGRGVDGRDFTIGVYPMLADETCWFLAIDFDKKTWHRDVAVIIQSARCNFVQGDTPARPQPDSLQGIRSDTVDCQGGLALPDRRAFASRGGADTHQAGRASDVRASLACSSTAIAWS